MALIAAVPWDEMPLRIGLAFVAGALIGFERENHGRAAGLRTTVLVCVSASIAMILSAELFDGASQSSGTWRPDPARLAAGILTGMGFLGAGAIMREGKIVRGVTTAAALWFTTILGLAFGAGHIALGLVGLGVAMLTLLVLPLIERQIHNDWYGNITVTVEMDGITEIELRDEIQKFGVSIKSVELDYDLPEKQRTISCRIKYKRGAVCELSTHVVQKLAACKGVLQVMWA